MGGKGVTGASPNRTPTDIDALGDLLEHRFSPQSTITTNLGHVTSDNFRVIPTNDAQPGKQRPHRHSPIFAAKVQIDTD